MQSPQTLRNDVLSPMYENRSGSKRPEADGQLEAQGPTKRRRMATGWPFAATPDGPVSSSDHLGADDGSRVPRVPIRTLDGLDRDRFKRDEGSSGSYGRSQGMNAENPRACLTRTEIIATLALYSKYRLEWEEDQENVEKYLLAYQSTAQIMAILQHYYTLDEVVRGVIDLHIHRWGMALDPRVEPPPPQIANETIVDENGSIEAWLDTVEAEYGGLLDDRVWPNT